MHNYDLKRAKDIIEKIKSMGKFVSTKKNTCITTLKKSENDRFSEEIESA